MMLISLALVLAGAWFAPRVLLTRHLGKAQRRALFGWGCAAAAILIIEAVSGIFASMLYRPVMPPLARLLGVYDTAVLRIPAATLTLGVAALSILWASGAMARDDVVSFPIADVLSQAQNASRLEGVQFFFGGQPHPDVAQNFGEFPTNKKTN